MFNAIHFLTFSALKTCFCFKKKGMSNILETTFPEHSLRDSLGPSSQTRWRSPERSTPTPVDRKPSKESDSDLSLELEDEEVTSHGAVQIRMVASDDEMCSTPQAGRREIKKLENCNTNKNQARTRSGHQNPRKDSKSSSLPAAERSIPQSQAPIFF